VEPGTGEIVRAPADWADGIIDAHPDVVVGVVAVLVLAAIAYLLKRFLE
jgi:hypothetical protein